MRVYDQSHLPAFIETRASVLKCAKCFETHAHFIHIIFNRFPLCSTIDCKEQNNSSSFEVASMNCLRQTFQKHALTIFITDAMLLTRFPDLNFSN